MLDNRFWSKVEKTKECWNWTAAKNPKGYGRYKVEGKCRSPHVLSFLNSGGVLLDKEEVCHTCDNPSCVRPDHLFAGTRSDNMKDCAEKGRISSRNHTATHCIHGHILLGDNLYLRKNGHRQCRECHRRRNRKYAQGIRT